MEPQKSIGRLKTAHSNTKSLYKNFNLSNMDTVPSTPSHKFN